MVRGRVKSPVNLGKGGGRLINGVSCSAEMMGLYVQAGWYNGFLTKLLDDWLLRREGEVSDPSPVVFLGGVLVMFKQLERNQVSHMPCKGHGGSRGFERGHSVLFRLTGSVDAIGCCQAPDVDFVDSLSSLLGDFGHHSHGPQVTFLVVVHEEDNLALLQGSRCRLPLG